MQPENFDFSKRRSYMGSNGTTTNGTLMVQIHDYDNARDEWKRWSAAAFARGLHPGHRNPEAIRTMLQIHTQGGRSRGARLPAGVPARQRHTRFHHISVPVINKPQGTSPRITHSHSMGSPKVRPKCSRTSHSVAVSLKASKRPGNAK